MTYTATVTEDGHAALPEELRQSLNIHPGDTLEFELTEGGAQFRVKRPNVREVLEEFRGLFLPSTARTREEALAEFRALRGRDQEDQDILDRWNAE